MDPSWWFLALPEEPFDVLCSALGKQLSAGHIHQPMPLLMADEAVEGLAEGFVRSHMNTVFESLILYDQGSRFGPYIVSHASANRVPPAYLLYCALPTDCRGLLGEWGVIRCPPDGVAQLHASARECMSRMSCTRFAVLRALAMGNNEPTDVRECMERLIDSLLVASSRKLGFVALPVCLGG